MRLTVLPWLAAVALAPSAEAREEEVLRLVSGAADLRATGLSVAGDVAHLELEVSWLAGQVCWNDLLESERDAVAGRLLAAARALARLRREGQDLPVEVQLYVSHPSPGEPRDMVCAADPEPAPPPMAVSDLRQEARLPKTVARRLGSLWAFVNSTAGRSLGGLPEPYPTVDSGPVTLRILPPTNEHLPGTGRVRLEVRLAHTLPEISYRPLPPLHSTAPPMASRLAKLSLATIGTLALFAGGRTALYDNAPPASRETERSDAFFVAALVSLSTALALHLVEGSSAAAEASAW